jgi:hypothetical protein
MITHLKPGDRVVLSPEGRDKGLVLPKGGRVWGSIRQPTPAGPSLIEIENLKTHQVEEWHPDFLERV